MNTRQLIASALGLTAAFCSPAWATPLLGSTAQTFAVLGAAGVSVNGSATTTINGNVGSAPANSVTGFPPGVISAGSLTSTTLAQLAQGDALAAYNFLAGVAPTMVLTGTDLGGLSLTPGVYFFASSAQLTGTLTLNALGDDNAVFIFQIGSTLTTAPSSIVSLINGNANDGIFWQVGSSATLNNSSLFLGNILADTSISLDPFAQIACGRALAGIVAPSGAVTMANGNHVAIDSGSGCAGGYSGGYESVAGGGFQRIAASQITSVPEAASLALFGAGLVPLVMSRRRKKS